jgi:hypothetical protein
MAKTPRRISVAASVLGDGRNVCALFKDDEEYRVLLPSIEDGFECGDKAIHVLNPDRFLPEFGPRRAKQIVPRTTVASRGHII